MKKFQDIVLKSLHRYQDKNMIPITILPVSIRKLNADNFLAPLYEELRQLESEGLRVTCEDGLIV